MSDQPVGFLRLTGFCPLCGASWRGQGIPGEYLEFYPKGSTHYSRLVGQYDINVDRTVSYRCPDCGYLFAAEALED